MSVKLDILNKIKEYDTIMIHGHTRPDGDCYGCQFGLQDIIKSSFPNKKVYVIGGISDYVSFLGTPDTISDEEYKGALAICVDCGNSPRLADQRFTLADYIIKIDHHIPVEHYGNIEWVEEEKPACTQMIYEFYKEFKDELKISQKGAFALYTGMVTDTGRFRFDSVNKDTFYAAGDLVDIGVNPQEVDNLLSVETLDILKFKGYVLSNFVLSEHGFVYIKITKETVEQYGISYEDAASQVSLLSTIEGYPVWALIIEYPDDIRVRLRSRGPAIDLLANKYNGGGHAKASGCSLKSFDDIPQFVKDAEEVILNYK